MARHCPHCGKSDADAEFYNEICKQCAKNRLAPLPVARVRFCPKCNAVIDKARKKKEWGMEQEVSRILKLKAASPVYAEGFASVEYVTPYGRISQDLLVLFDKVLCEVCSRAGSQYFEAIMQLRGDPKKIERMEKVLIRRIESRSFIPKIEELKEGIDIYCGSRNEAIAALNSQSLGFLRTEKLAGEKNGKRLYRTTLLIRL